MNFIKEFKDNFFKVMQCPDEQSKDEAKFKLLIYDKETFNILNHFKVIDLREQLICDHVDIVSQKEEILGINAIYFVAPTKENFDIII